MEKVLMVDGLMVVEWKFQKVRAERNGNGSGGEKRHLLMVKKLSANAFLPKRGSPLSAGYDLSSASAAVVPARGKALIQTDPSIAIPEGTYARIAPRSGLAWKHSIDVGAGVIDADYCGPVGVVLFNHSDLDFEVKGGDRIAQLILERIITPDVCEVEDLDSTIRGAGGFGSTGRAICLFMQTLCRKGKCTMLGLKWEEEEHPPSLRRNSPLGEDEDSISSSGSSLSGRGFSRSRAVSSNMSENVNKFSIENCLEVVYHLTSESNIILDAMDKFDKESQRRGFLALPEELQLKWLLKLGGQ